MMEEFYVKKITEEVFKKAKDKSASHKKYALAKEVEAATGLSYRTIERTYDRYIRRKDEDYNPSSNTIEEFCVYLGYQDYAEYVEKHKAKEPDNGPLPSSLKDQNETQDSSTGAATKPGQKIWRYAAIFGTFTLTLLLVLYLIIQNKTSEVADSENCMTWTGRFYKKTPCSKGSYSTYGNTIEPYDEKRFENFKRVEVDITTPFFSEQNQKPLLWYYKNEQGEIEYYTAPGLHPVNGKTLKAVTEYIVEKYVPIHQNKPSSFVRE
ncbi:hypothetical protein [Leeuwenhoekiella parthenopeia]|uniref:Helix-turn-helix domain-containing protein n=1 Tax=Leeuwenhoekiella parthenopeia TaxID=2890320 RepID=A0ABS8GPU2_9FLAO|nr:hypothetical protein [Leeuwenhoekiella parthenopeia]MCC4212024.1 hypothetical protein [Leeuwenhoekiella parthenopeia]